jgi:hypothetical protein
MNLINFPIKNLQGLDGCKRMGLDDTLAISIVFSTNKQMYPDFKKRPFSGPQKIRNENVLIIFCQFSVHFLI